MRRLPAQMLLRPLAAVALVLVVCSPSHARAFAIVTWAAPRQRHAVGGARSLPRPALHAPDHRSCRGSTSTSTGPGAATALASRSRSSR